MFYNLPQFRFLQFLLMLKVAFILSLSTPGGFEPPMEMPGALQERLPSELSYFYLQITFEQYLKRVLPESE